MYVEIEKNDELNNKYRRIVIKKFVVLYTIDIKRKTVYISHIYYGGKNYLNRYSFK
ncbi:MAG: hypothetical protein IJ094_08925 [Bacilli bacterium]|nr:hypothetical protein [Bacilli bacterium]